MDLLQQSESDYGGAERQCVPAGAQGRRVLRGGSWGSLPGLARGAYRFWFTAVYRFGDVGFRLAQD